MEGIRILMQLMTFYRTKNGEIREHLHFLITSFSHGWPFDYHAMFWNSFFLIQNFKKNRFFNFFAGKRTLRRRGKNQYMC
jgi:hypothetical protein